MAELIISTVNPSSANSTVPEIVQVGEAVSEGDFGYYNSGTEKYLLANNATAAEAACTVMFLKSASADEYTYIAKPGDSLVLNVSTASGEYYCVASTDGQCEPHADVASSEYVSQVFVGTGSTTIVFSPRPSGYAKP